MTLTYAGSGVDYDALDAFKRQAQQAALRTAENIRRNSDNELSELVRSRGESAYLIEAGRSIFAHVEEGLGTKNLVADAMAKLTGKSYYRNVAQCTVAMIVNDMITTGAMPLSVAMHLAVGDSKWFEDKERASELIEGWADACDLARCAWGGGETPTLKGIIYPEASLLAGSAIGIVSPKERHFDPYKIRKSDAIILVESNGIHANGLTLAREIADKPHVGYLAPMSDGRTFGEALLDPTHIYVGLVADCLAAGVDIHYAINITGHGWRKLMRAPRPWEYVIEEMPPLPPVFSFIEEHGPVERREMFANYNMGAGFCLIVRDEDVATVLGAADKNGMGATIAGSVRASEERKVSILPMGIEFLSDELAVR